MMLAYKSYFMRGSASQIFILTVLTSNSSADFDISLVVELRCRLNEISVSCQRALTVIRHLVFHLMLPVVANCMLFS